MHLIRLLMVCLLASSLMVCSGSDDSDKENALKLEFFDAEGQSLTDRRFEVFGKDEFELVVKLAKGKTGIANKDVLLKITRGTLTTTGGKTDSDGDAQFTLMVTGALGDVSLKALVEYEGRVIERSITMAVISNNPVLTIEVLDDEETEYATAENPMDNTLDALVRVHVKRPSGDVVKQKQVQFDSTIGNLSLSFANTDGAGNAEAQLSITAAGIGLLTASISEAGEIIEAERTVHASYDYGNPRMGVLIDETFSLAGIWVADSGTSQISGSDDFSPVLGNHRLEHGEEAQVRVDILSEYDDEVIFPQPVVITFSSTCAEEGKASFGEDALNSVVLASSNGLAQTSYRTEECFYEDEIEATFDYGGTGYIARAFIDLPIPEVDTLGNFQSEWSNLVLAEVKRPEYPLIPAALVADYSDPFEIPYGDLSFLWQRHSSAFSFEVLAEDGEPLVGQTVDFVIGPASTADPELSSYTEISDASGNVSSVVTGGGTVGIFSIFAQAGSGLDALVSISPPLRVSSGVPVDGGLTLSVTQVNPYAWGRDGAIVTLVADVKDRLGYPIQDGVAVMFDAEFGELSKSYCVTENGACSVFWSSLASDTSHPSARDIATNNGLDGKNDRFGRSTITAMVLGEERFIDGDGGGALDDRYDEALESGGVTQLPEVFFDYNENSSRDSGSYSEPYHDHNDNGAYDLADAAFQGGACLEGSVECDDYLMIKDQINLVMASNVVKLYLSHDEMNLGLVENYTIISDTTLDLDDSVTLINDASPSFLVPAGGTPLYFGVTDENGNSAPLGTEIQISANAPGIGFTSENQVSQSSNISFYVGASTEPYFDMFTLFANPGVAGSATLRISTPDGVITEKNLLIEGEL